jgi:hypothetical protein
VALVAADILTIDLPGDDWCSTETPHSTAFVRAHDLAYAGGDPTWCSFAIYVELVGADSSALHRVAENLMARRVREGYPGRFKTELGGVPALGYDYTDGVSNLRSYFAPCPSGGIVELCIRKAVASYGEHQVPLESAAEFVLAGIRWTPSWTVWRQDDNGAVDKVSTVATQGEAQRLMEDLEAKGHKQVYWIVGPEPEERD